MADANKGSDPLSRGLGMAIALGALAVGAAAAFLNNERSRQMREDLQRQISDVSNRLDRELAARRPEIEDAIHRGRQVAIGGLERVRGAVEQGADRAQEYVQRASTKTSDVAVDMRDSTTNAAEQTANKAEDTIDSVSAKTENALDETVSGAQDTWTNAAMEAEASTESAGEDKA